MKKIKFSKDVAPFKKGDIVEASDRLAALMINKDGDNCEVTDAAATVTGKSLNARIAKANKEEAERLRKKADELAEK